MASLQESAPTSQITGQHTPTGRKNKYHLNNFTRAMKSWLFPYLKGRFIDSNGFHPVLCFLYTDLNCNLDCHYCYSKGKRIPGMTMEVAKDAVHWLHERGCRVLAYMGGEPLVRKKFILELTRYAVEKGFFVYLPTNGILLDRNFIDQIGEAGVSTINLAVDALERRPGLPKAFDRIKPQFEYLVEREKAYGYITFFNINITPENLDDVIRLTEIAHDHGIATDYHINEAPLIEYEGFEPVNNGGWSHEDTQKKVDRVIDWLIEKNRQGYTMANSVEHLQAMKPFIRQELPPWDCKAGTLSMIMRLDGTFAPCFELYGAKEPWGSIYDGDQFDAKSLAKRKKDCSPHCLSTCNYQVKHYTGSIWYSFQWLTKHAQSHFFGVS